MHMYTHIHMYCNYINQFLISYLKPWPSNFNDAQILANDAKTVKFNNTYVCINIHTHLYGCINKGFIIFSEIVCVSVCVCMCV